MTQPENSQATDTAGGIPPWVVSFLRWAGVSLALGVVFAWFGVYETSAIPFPERVIYWTLLMVIGVIGSIVITPRVYEKWMPKAHPALQIAVVAGLISIPILIGLIALEATDGTLSTPDWWALQYFYVVVVSALLTAAAWLIERVAAKPAEGAAPAAGSALASSFTDRLPVKFRTGLIYAVSAEDHYLRIHTSLGETMILMRLADAVRELAGLEGLQTHRSWWVAKQGLADVVKGDGKLILKLKSGVEAPVSRTYQKAVKDAGWT